MHQGGATIALQPSEGTEGLVQLRLGYVLPVLDLPQGDVGDARKIRKVVLGQTERLAACENAVRIEGLGRHM